MRNRQKTIIISDTHLNSNFEPRKFALLQRLILSADRVILNGDFWDSYQTDFSKFTASAWSRLFPILSSRETIYLFGNHDLPQWTSRPEIFAHHWGWQWRMKVGQVELNIEHGHRLATSFDLRFPTIARQATRILPWIGLHTPGFVNKRSQNMIATAANKNSGSSLLICGHSHLPVIDLEKKYANSGCFLAGQASWLELEQDRLTLKRTTY